MKIGNIFAMGEGCCEEGGVTVATQGEVSGTT